MKRVLGICGVAGLVAACAASDSSGIVALGPDVFLVENRGGMLSGVVDRTLEDAVGFCASQGAQAEMVTTRVNPDSYQVVFRCNGRPGLVREVFVEQPRGAPATAPTTRAVLEPGDRRRRGRVVSAPDWAQGPELAPLSPVPTAPVGWAGAAPMAQPALVQASPGNPFVAAPPPGTVWASPGQAAPFVSALPPSVQTPPVMPVITPAPAEAPAARRGRGRRAEPAPVAEAPAPMAPAAAGWGVPVGVPLLPSPAAAPAAAQPPALAPVAAPPIMVPTTGLPGPAQVPALAPRGRAAEAAPVFQPAAVVAQPMQPVAGFQPSEAPLPAASQPLTAAPPAGFWAMPR